MALSTATWDGADRLRRAGQQAQADRPGRRIPRIREELLGFGAPSEVDMGARLVALDVPVGVDIRPVLNYLVLGQESEWFDFEEGALRHALPGRLVRGNG